MIPSNRSMKSNQLNAAQGRSRRVPSTWRGRLASLLLAALVSTVALGAVATPAAADEYDESMAGHPLRIVAYVLHPVGVVIDYLIMRPAHWLVSHEPLETLFGHED